MGHAFDYTNPLWRAVARRAIARDGRRCAVARLLGGRCSGTLHAHHIEPVSEGGASYDLDNVLTACSRHHPQIEALRRAILRKRVENAVAEAAELRGPRCPHQHRSVEARRICEQRIARARGLIAA